MNKNYQGLYISKDGNIYGRLSKTLWTKLFHRFGGYNYIMYNIAPVYDFDNYSTFFRELDDDEIAHLLVINYEEDVIRDMKQKHDKNKEIIMDMLRFDK